MNRPAGRPEQSGRPAWLSRVELAHRAWRYKWRVDPAGIRWMLGVLKAGDVTVDAGAYKGGYTYWMRRAVGERGAVFAFEPQPAAAAMLRRYVAAFRWTNVTVSESALSSSVGTCTLLTPGDQGVSPAASLVGASLQPGARALTVPVDPLDKWLARHAPGARVDLLKIDVEGHELDVFRGAERVLREHRPSLLVECEPRHLRDVTVADVFGHLKRLGYHGSFVWRGRVTDASLFDPRVHQVPGRRPYANNFMFVTTTEA